MKIISDAAGENLPLTSKDWEYHGTQFEGEAGLNLNIRRVVPTKNGEYRVSVRVSYDGSKLNIEGGLAAFSFALLLEQGELSQKLALSIRSAAGQAFANPRTSFLSTEELYSSD